MRTISTVEEVYRVFTDVSIFHAIPRYGAKSDIPASKTFVERIEYTIKNSSAEKVSAFSVQFGKGSVDNKVFGTRSSTGIGIKSGKIFRHFRSDSGFREEHIDSPFYRECDDIDDVIRGDGKSHNEFILTDVEPCCIYYYKSLFDYSMDEIVDACKTHGLPLYELTEHGLRGKR